MVWNPSQSQRLSQPTTLLILPPLPVNIIADQWEEQLPGGSGIWLDDDEAEGRKEDDADAPREGEVEIDVMEESNGIVKGEREGEGVISKDETAEGEGWPVILGRRKREDVDASHENAEDTEKTNDRGSLSHPEESLSAATKRKRDDSHHIPHSKPLPPSSSSHPYQRNPTLTQSHLQPEVIAAAQVIASKHGIKLALSSDDLGKVDLTAYQNALTDPSTIGNGAVALARARRARMNGNGSVDGMFEDGTASPGPMTGGAGYGTPGPNGGSGTPAPSTPAGARGSTKGRSRGIGRWGHLYAKRAQQAAAAAVAAKQAEEAATAAAALASAQSYLAAQSAAQGEEEGGITEVDKEKEEREERERAEEGLALMKAMEEKKKETMAKGLGSASYWNHLLIEARRQRGPQWDVNTQSYQVDRGSALYYSNVHGPPPSPPPASPPKLPQEVLARTEMPIMGSQQPLLAMQAAGGQQGQRPGFNAGQSSYSGVQADPRLQYPSQQIPQQQQAQMPQWMIGLSGGPQQQRPTSGTPAVPDGQRPGSSGQQNSMMQSIPPMQNQGVSISNATHGTPPQVAQAQALAQRQQSTGQTQLAQMHRSLQDQQAAQQQQQLLALQAQRHRDMMAARMAGLQQAAAGGSPASSIQQQQQGQSQQQQRGGLASNLAVGLNGGQWPMIQGLTAAQLSGLQQSYQSSSQPQSQPQSQQFMQQGGMFPATNNMMGYGGGMMGKMNLQGTQIPQMGQYAQQQQPQQQQQQGGNA